MHKFIAPEVVALLVLIALSGCSMFKKDDSAQLASASSGEVIYTREKVVGSILKESRCRSTAQLDAEEQQARALLHELKMRNAVLRSR